jgi:hypothetical protein
MVGQMNLFAPRWKRVDVKNMSMTNPFKISDDRSLFIPSKNDNEIELAKELRKGRIQRPSTHKERGHPSLVDGEDSFGVESLIH